MAPLRWGIGGLFLVAGGAKLWDPAQFLIAVESFRLGPPPLAVVAALVIPSLELVCGAALLRGRAVGGALAWLALLLLLFLGALASAWARGLDVTCGCFGATAHIQYPWFIARDLGLLALVGWLAWGKIRRA